VIADWAFGKETFILRVVCGSSWRSLAQVTFARRGKREFMIIG
jgi:hypothetical protein